MTSDLFLVAGAALASAVEMVEAMTIVLALGTTRGWRWPLVGSAAALVLLSVIVAALGPALARIPIGALRLVVGSLLLLFGLQWLRKAILRAAGRKALHDEVAVFAAETARARAAGRAAATDWYSLVLSFKSVLLEGLEVAFIVLTLGTAQGKTALAAGGAAVALVVVGVTGLALRAPLSRVPENALKFTVGILLTSFGVFWSTEGAGADWPGGDIALIALIAVTLGWSALMVRALRAPGGASRAEALP